MELFNDVKYGLEILQEVREGQYDSSAGKVGGLESARRERDARRNRSFP